MKSLICPISTQRINHSVVRLTGFMMALMIALFLLTGNIAFVLVIVVDYFIRAFTTLPYSPFSWIAAQIARRAGLSTNQIDKAPKIFAARVGFLFALATVVLFPLNPLAGMIVGATLMTFALLESILDICMGCLVYTYLVFPLLGRS